MEEILRPLKNPNAGLSKLDHYNSDLYSTETKRQYQSFDKDQEKHYKDLKTKDEVTTTRRMLESYNASTIKKAIG